MKELDKEYRKIAIPWLRARPFCGVKSPECTGVTEGVHHKKGKKTKALRLDVNHFMASCNACNTYIEDHHEWAVNMGYLESRV